MSRSEAKKSTGALAKKKRFSAASDGVGQQFIDWASEHGIAGIVALAIVCIATIGALFWFVVFSDFSASADFIYNQF